MSYLQRRRFLAAAAAPALLDQEPAEAGKLLSGSVATLAHGPPRRLA